MFKKPIKFSSSNTISGKDRKKIRKDLSKNFNNESVDQLFINNEEIIVEKVQGNKMHIYRNQTQPLFVDTSGKGDYFPTVYTINSFPGFCKMLYLNPSVDTFVKKGANLMWPGVANKDG